ncbi:unnamed protein product [Effrenium voratum]|nr:unnamed protein product [Effrenium voratum]
MQWMRHSPWLSHARNGASLVLGRGWGATPGPSGRRRVPTRALAAPGAGGHSCSRAGTLDCRKASLAAAAAARVPAACAGLERLREVRGVVLRIPGSLKESNTYRCSSKVIDQHFWLEVIAPAIAGDAISHVFFTSGSTGKPKGCVVAHCSLRSYCLAKNATYKLGAESVCLVASAHTFDPSLGDFMSTWAAGGCVALGPRPAPNVSHGGVALDAVTLGQQGVTWGFGIAKAATQLGFGVANTAVQRTGEVGGPAAQVVTGGVQQVLAFAQGATHFGQDLAQGITQASLGAARMSLGAAGAQEGELLRLAVGDEAAESVMMVLQMVRRFCSSLGPVTWAQLMLAARAWTGAQQAARLELNARGPFQPVMLPPHAERAMRFSAATFGAQFLAGLAASYAELLQVINVPFRELMDMLADIDRAILQEKLRLEREEAEEVEKARAAAAKEEEEVARLGSDDEDLLDSPVSEVRTVVSTRSVSAAGAAALAARRFRAPVLSPKAKAMSLRRVALRRHSDHMVAESAEEAMASFAAASFAGACAETNENSNPNEPQNEKEHVLPPLPDLNRSGEIPADPV